MEQGCPIIAAIVLYRMKAGESRAFKALADTLAENEDCAQAIDVMVFDNTPYLQDAPAGFSGTYVQDPSNPGLAQHYNFALNAAIERKAEWLMLLDQDSSPTREYFEEAVALSSRFKHDQEIVALAPKLIENGAVLAPHRLAMLRHPKAIDIGLAGVAQENIYPYNSASVIRVSALEAIGGFPQKFWLDYLDHATFRMLQSRVGKIYVMRTILEHSLSSNQPIRSNDAGAVARRTNILKAEHAFYRDYGTFLERACHHARLFWRAVKALREGAFRYSFELLKTGLRP